MKNFQNLSGELVKITHQQIEEIKKYDNVLTEETKPVDIDKRDWSGWNLSSIWISILFSIPGYMLVSGFIASGMSWKQSLFVVILGHLLVMGITVSLGHFGTKYGLSYTLVSKMTFGPKGNVFPTMIRTLLGSIWFALQCWIGGMALSSLIGVIIPSWNNVEARYIVCFVVFLGINLIIANKGLDAIKTLSGYAMPVLICIGTATVIWAYKKAGGVGAIFNHSAVVGNGVDFKKMFIPSLTAAMGIDGAVSLNMCDFTSHAKSQKSQTLGQLLQIPFAAMFIVIVSVCGTVASTITFGAPAWSATEIVGQLNNPIAVVLASLAILFVTVTINVSANLAPSSIVLSNLWPKKINYKKGLIIVALFAVVLQPWKMLASADSYIFKVNAMLATFIGPMQGIYFASYWVERKTSIDFVDLYRNDGGLYYYNKGYNISAVLVMAIVTIVLISGNFIPALKFLFDGSYLFGFIGGTVFYLIFGKFTDKDLISERKAS